MYEPAILATLTIAIVEVIKKMAFVPERLYPVLSMGLGFGMGITLGNDWIISLMIGTAASGVYDIVKKTLVV